MKPLVYQAKINKVLYQGPYSVIVNLAGTTKKRECFQREYLLDAFADVVLAPNLVQKAVAIAELRPNPFYSPAVLKAIQEPAPAGFQRKVVRIEPRDEQGNWFGVGRASEIAVALTDAQAIGTLQDTYDGAYEQVVQYAKESEPRVAVSVGSVAAPSISVAEPERPLNGWIYLLGLLVVLILLFILWRRRPA